MKDLMAKLNLMFTVMDHREERLLAAMNQRDVKVDELVAILDLFIIYLNVYRPCNFPTIFLHLILYLIYLDLFLHLL